MHKQMALFDPLQMAPTLDHMYFVALVACVWLKWVMRTRIVTNHAMDITLDSCDGRVDFHIGMDRHSTNLVNCVL